MSTRTSHLTFSRAFGIGSFRFDTPGAGDRPPVTPPADDLKSLRDEFAQLHKDTGDLLKKAATEKRELTAEEKATKDKQFARMDAIKGMVDDHARYAALTLQQGKAVTPQGPEGRKEFEAFEGRERFAGADGKFDLDAYKRALNQYARTGSSRVRELFTVTSGTDSGAYLPKQVLAPVEVRRLDNCFRAALAAGGYMPIETDSTSAFSLPVADDTANEGDTGETTAAAEQDPAQAGLSMVPTLTRSKQFWYSNTMVLAQGFDVAAHTLPMAQKRIDKAQESAWTVLLRTAPVGFTTVGAVATYTVTHAHLLSWEHSLPAAYRRDAVFMVSDSLYKSIRSMVDSQGRPIMDLDPTGVFQGKIHGRPVVINDDLDATTVANGISGAFVSADAIKIVDCLSPRLVRYANYPQKPDQIGFEMFTNGDCKFVTSGVRLLRNAAA